VAPLGRSGLAVTPSSLLDRLAPGWTRFWFEEIPPHSYAVFRILVGVVGAVTVVGAWNPAFWQLSGIVPSYGGWRLWPWLTAHGIGDVAGLTLRWVLLIGYVCLALGIRTWTAALAMFLGSAGMIWWNSFPLSGAQQLLHNLTFPLVFVDSGSVWSVDALLRARRNGSRRAPKEPIWPLRLLQFQLALMYFSAGLWKMGNPDWRSGDALHYVLNNPVFQRVPGVVPPALYGATVALTYLTVFWELTFPVLVWFRRSRPLMLLVGVALHLGMLATLELGAFTPTVLIAYVSFLDPWRTERRVNRLFGLARADEGRALAAH
jgi:hypothetical protein